MIHYVLLSYCIEKDMHNYNIHKKTTATYMHIVYIMYLEHRHSQLQF